METITLFVGAMSMNERLAIENVVGHSLRENQKVTIQVADVNASVSKASASANDDSMLPTWCNVYDGLTDAQLESLEATILNRVNLTRAAI